MSLLVGTRRHESRRRMGTCMSNTMFHVFYIDQSRMSRFVRFPPGPPVHSVTFFYYLQRNIIVSTRRCTLNSRLFDRHTTCYNKGHKRPYTEDYPSRPRDNVTISVRRRFYNVQNVSAVYVLKRPGDPVGGHTCV